MRDTASTTSAPGRKKRVTSSVVSTKANARTPVKCSRSAWVSISVKWLNPATEPLTSHSTTSSGLCTARGRWWVTSGMPPVASEARTVRRKSSRPSRPSRRRADSLAAGRRRDGPAQLGEVGLLGTQEVDLVGQRPDGVAGDLVPSLLRGGPAAHLGLHRRPERRDPLLG